MLTPVFVAISICMQPTEFMLSMASQRAVRKEEKLRRPNVAASLGIVAPSPA